MLESPKFNSRRLIVPVVSLIIIGCCYWWCCYIKNPITTVFVVRHADRTGSVDELNSLGLARAQELARVLGGANVSAVFASTANRAQQTANPLATQLGLTVNSYDATNDAAIQAMVDQILSQYRGKTVLIVGHSNTVGNTIAKFGVDSPGNIPDTQFDNLYVVSHSRKSITKLTKLKYGAVTP